jgi:serine/threonine-protein kinase
MAGRSYITERRSASPPSWGVLGCGSTRMPTDCLEDDTILAFVNRQLPLEHLDALDEHLDACLLCRRIVAEYARDGLAPLSASAAETALAPEAATLGIYRGTVIDRYIVIAAVGSGSMGTVYEAYDPQLQRRVALKLIKEDLSPGAADLLARRARLLREAQAMARLSHPNVITVYDAGVYQESVYLVMELINGATLRQRCAAQPAGFCERVALFLAAGRGLAAAHQAGLVHRDFKPDNVLVGEDGRVRVGDFGLVSLAEHAPPGALPHGTVETPEPPQGIAMDSLTQSGAVLGTLRYLAPEQHKGQGASALSDQFSFCVSLYEALYGQPPFAGATYQTLQENVLKGCVGSEPPGTLVPAWLRAVLLRGLSTQPGQRYPSMTELLSALAREAQARRRQRLYYLGLAMSLAAAAGLGAASWRALSPPRTTQCKDLGEPVTAVWNQAARDRVRDAFLRSKRTDAAATYARVGRMIDDYAARWIDQREHACAATRVRGTQSEQLLDLRMHCLDQRLAELGAELAVFAEFGQEPEVLDHAVTAVARLSPLLRCSDGEALRADYPRPTDPRLRAQVEQLEQQLDRASALQNAGRYKDALRIAETTAQAVDPAAYPPLGAKAFFRLLVLQNLGEEYKAAEATVQTAALWAARAHDDGLSAEVELQWLAILISMARYDEALALRPIIEAAIARSGDEDLKKLRLQSNLGTIYLRKDDKPRARKYYEEALAIGEKALPPGSPDRSEILQNLALLLYMEGDYAAAQTRFERALSMQEESLGENHPEVARILHHLCLIRVAVRDLQGAQELCTHALAIQVAALGEAHRSVLLMRSTLAQIYTLTGQPEKARKSLAQVLAIQEQTLGPTHPQLGPTLNNLSDVLRSLNRYDEAAEALKRALDIKSKTLGPNHTSLGVSLTNYGILLNHQHKFKQARPYFEHALRIFEAGSAAGKVHPNAVVALLGIGQCDIELGKPARALRPIERALQIGATTPGSTVLVASARFLLAQALVASSRDRARARVLVQQARTGLMKAGPEAAEQLTELKGWLRRQREFAARP